VHEQMSGMLNPMMGGDNPLKRKLDASLGAEEDEPPQKKRQGRRKIKIEFIEDKSRRQITFSKRKAGIMKKAYELTTLTGTQALLLIASETGHVYTFATSKLQPFVTHQEGKTLIQRCLNSEGVEESFQPTYMERSGGQYTPEPAPQTTTEAVESTLVLIVGKAIPVLPPFNLGSMTDLKCTANSFSVDGGPHITCLAGGFPTSLFDRDANPNYPIQVSEVIAGWKVAEVDYTSEHQPAFAIETLRGFLHEASSHLPPALWSQLAAKPYVNNALTNNTNTDGDASAAGDVNKPADTGSGGMWMSESLSLFVVSTYQNACVNVVFGVRTVGEGGHQVVGISCMPPESHVCKLEVEEGVHERRLMMTTEVEGSPLYHLLPELKG